MHCIVSWFESVVNKVICHRGVVPYKSEYAVSTECKKTLLKYTSLSGAAIATYILALSPVCLLQTLMYCY